MLRIHRPGSLWGEAEEFGIELVDPVQQGRAPHVGGIRQSLLADTGGQQVFLGQGDNRLLTAAKVVPELRQRVGAGKSGGHAHHRNRVGWQFIVAGHARSPTFRRAPARCRAAARC